MAAPIKREILPQPTPIFRFGINSGGTLSEGPLPAPAGSSYPVITTPKRVPFNPLIPRSQ
jgi:hypothetical protein